MRTDTLLTLVAITASAFLIWTILGRTPPPPSPAMRLAEVRSLGDDEGAGAVVALQPWLAPVDYVEPERVRAKLSDALWAVRARGVLRARAVVVLPAHVGTFLVVAGEKADVLRRQSWREALELMAASNAPRFALALLQGGRGRAPFDAVARMKALEMRDAYVAIMSALAREHEVSLVAGTVVLPGPSLSPNGVDVDLTGPLREVSVVFDTRGVPRAVIAAGHASDAAPFNVEPVAACCGVVDVDGTRVAVVMEEDAMHAATSALLRDARPDVVAVPAWLPARQGTDDPARFTDALLRRGVLGRVQGTGARVGAVSFLRGPLWDFGLDGAPLVVQSGEVRALRPWEGASVLHVPIPAS